MITLWVPQAGITFMVVMENWSEYLIIKRSHICCTDYFWQGHIPSNQNLRLMNMATRWVLMQSLMIYHGRRNVAPGSRQADEIQEQLQDENAQGW